MRFWFLFKQSRCRFILLRRVGARVGEGISRLACLPVSSEFVDALYLSWKRRGTFDWPLCLVSCSDWVFGLTSFPIWICFSRVNEIWDSSQCATRTLVFSALMRWILKGRWFRCSTRQLVFVPWIYLRLSREPSIPIKSRKWLMSSNRGPFMWAILSYLPLLKLKQRVVPRTHARVQ